jgi:4-hydroxy-tetrahydrodipicolinate reductase
MADLKIVVAGASGRMGRTLIREIAQGSGMVLCGALEAEGHPDLGLDAGTLAGMQPNGIKLTADPLAASRRCPGGDRFHPTPWSPPCWRIWPLRRASSM